MERTPKPPKTLAARTRRLGRLLGFCLILPAILAGPASSQILELGPWPEACSRIEHPAAVTVSNVATVGDSLEISHTVAGLASKHVVVIFNGNNYPDATYGDLIDHLVQQEFIVANAQRPGNSGGNAAYIVAAVNEVIAALGIAANDPALRIGLVGHSQGGRLILEGAALNLGDEIQVPIRALVALSPASEPTSVMNDWNMPAYFALYGSQDEDLDGYFGNVIEAFRAYDQVGTESTTTCNAPPCLAFVPRVDKTMVFAYGADHAGLLGYRNSGAPGQPQDTEYIDPKDQLCLSKAYTTAFFNWHLGGDSSFKGFIRDEWRPLAIKAMRNDAPDGVGHAIGEKIRLFHQISPKDRKVIQNFQISDGAPLTSPSVMVQHAPALVFDQAPFYVRHNTGGAFVGWPTDGLQWARWDIPAGSQVASTYTHLAIRLGQVTGLEEREPTANRPGKDLTIYLGISDTSGNTDLFPLVVPYPDPYLDDLSKARTAMNTFRIEVADITRDFDLNNVDRIYLIMPSGSRGTVLVDSMEWHRD